MVEETECRCAFCEDVYGNGDDFKEFNGDIACDDCYVGCLELVREELEFDLENSVSASDHNRILREEGESYSYRILQLKERLQDKEVEIKKLIQLGNV